MQALRKCSSLRPACIHNGQDFGRFLGACGCGVEAICKKGEEEIV